MKFIDIQLGLKNQIRDGLSPLIDRNYRLLEMPDYPNVGDMLIFQGEIEFLKTIPHKCIEMATMKSFAIRLPEIPEDELLVFSGGGYFGDLWPAGPTFQRLILEKYPHNPMLILPQSVSFKDPQKLSDAVARYGSHKNLSVCLRDRASYDFFKTYFSNKAYLVPDMAFYADVDGWRNRKTLSSGKLLLLRNDKEINTSGSLARLQRDGDFCVRDWPTLEFNRRDYVEGVKFWAKSKNTICRTVYDWLIKTFYRRHILRSGIRFIDQFEEVASTRLHGCILGLLLGKKVKAFDNSYGKIHALVDTWLAECDDISKVV